MYLSSLFCKKYFCNYLFRPKTVVNRSNDTYFLNGTTNNIRATDIATYKLIRPRPRGYPVKSINIHVTLPCLEGWWDPFLSNHNYFTESSKVPDLSVKVPTAMKCTVYCA